MGVVEQGISAPLIYPFLSFWKGITAMEVLRWHLKSNTKEFRGMFTEVQTVVENTEVF